MNPFYGLLVYFCFAIVKPESMWYWSVPAGNYSRVVAMALLVGWAIQGFGSWEFGRARAIVLIMLGCWGWWILGAVFAENQYVAWRSVEAQSKIYLPVLVGITVINSLRQLKILAWVLMLSQAFVAWELNLSYFAGYNRLTDIGFGGLDNNSAAIGLVTGAGLAFFLGLHETRLWRQALCFGSAALMAHAVMFSFSRGGMLGLVVMGGVALFLVPKRPKDYAIFAVALVIGLRLAGPEVIGRFTTAFTSEEQRDASAESRLVLWAACFDMMLRFPILGAGPNHFPEYVDEYGFPRGKGSSFDLDAAGSRNGVSRLGVVRGFLCRDDLETGMAADWLTRSGSLVYRLSPHGGRVAFWICGLWNVCKPRKSRIALLRCADGSGCD